MKTLLLVSILLGQFLSCSNTTTKSAATIVETPQHKPQPKVASISFANTTWKTQGISFCDKERTDYILTSNEKSDFFESRWGYFIEFKEDGTFNSYYSAPCGNDCFPSSSGTYSITPEDELKIYVNLASQRGFCEQKTFLENEDLGIFKITKGKDNSYILKRI